MWPFPSSQPVGLCLRLRGTEGGQSLYDLEQIVSDPIKGQLEATCLCLAAKKFNRHDLR